MKLNCEKMIIINHTQSCQKTLYPSQLWGGLLREAICYTSGQRWKVLPSIHARVWILEQRWGSEGSPVTSPSLLSGAAEESFANTAVSFRYNSLNLSPPNMLFPQPFHHKDPVANNIFGINLNSLALTLITLCKLENVPSRLWGNSSQMHCNILVCLKYLHFDKSILTQTRFWSLSGTHFHHINLNLLSSFNNYLQNLHSSFP